MVKTTYVCDKCHSSFNEKDSLWNIHVGFGLPAYGYSHNECLDLDLCVNCMEKLGMVKRVIKNDEIDVEKISLKDKLYDIMVELVAETGFQAEY
jgi:hypothetical protein